MLCSCTTDPASDTRLGADDKVARVSKYDGALTKMYQATDTLGGVLVLARETGIVKYSSWILH